MISSIKIFTAVYEILMLTYCDFVASEDDIPTTLIESCIPYVTITDTSIRIGDSVINVDFVDDEADADDDEAYCDFVWTIHRDDNRVWSFDPYDDENSWDFLMNLVNRFSAEQLSNDVLKAMYTKVKSARSDTTLTEEWQQTFEEISEYLEKYASDAL